MNKELDNYLCKTYPKIFIERKLSPQESCLGRGLECGSGWMPIIDSLCHNIQQHIDGHNEEAIIPQFVATQVKEKFGKLRIYHRGGDDYCRGLVDMAISWSWITCETCGIGGPIFVGHTTEVISSTCEKCAKKNKRSRVYFNENLRDQMLKEI